MVKLVDLSPFLPNISINIQISLLEDAGLDIRPVLEAAGLTREDLEDAALLVSGAQELAVQLAFARATATRRDLWVAAGLRYRLFVYYPLGFALITAPSLDAALTLLLRFAKLHYGLMDYVLIEDAEGNLGIEARYDEGLSDVLDFLRCRDTIAMTTWFHELWGGRFPFSRIETPSAMPHEYGFNYQAPVIHTQGRSRWLWGRSLMRSAPAYSDPVLHKIYIAQCESINAAAPAAGLGRRPAPRISPDPFMVQVMDRLECSGRFDWTLDQLARELSMSRRSLQRKLTYRGVTFRMIVDGNRCRTAKRLLAKRGQSIAEIAWQLGYADASSFHQAFIRWTQMSPSAYRKRREPMGSPSAVSAARIVPGSS